MRGTCGAGRAHHPLEVTHAFHSALMEPVLKPLEAAVATVRFQIPHAGIISNLYGRLASREELSDPQCWRRRREPVEFFAGMRTLAQQGIDAIVEVGPKPVLLVLGGGAW